MNPTPVLNTHGAKPPKQPTAIGGYHYCHSDFSVVAPTPAQNEVAAGWWLSSYTRAL